MSTKLNLKKFLWKLGWDINRFKPPFHPIASKQHLFGSIKTVLDIGANTGQFACSLRNIVGYKDRIISFEPTTSAFNSLTEKSKHDPNWDIYKTALGDFDGCNEINLSENSVSSSLLDMLPSHIKSAPDSGYIGKEQIEVKKLDSIFDSLGQIDSAVYMKIDTQGFERQVLNGAEKSLLKIDYVQLEMSLVPLYDGETLFDDLCKLMCDLGYVLVKIDTGHKDPNTSQVLQLDGLFHRFK